MRKDEEKNFVADSDPEAEEPTGQPAESALTPALTPAPTPALTPAERAERAEAIRVATVRRGVMRLARGLRGARSPGALSGNQLTVLSRLYRFGPQTPTEIAAADRQQPQSLTRTFADLERLDLIRRTRSEADRRQYLLEITEAGLFALGSDMAVRDAWLGERMAALSETEREVLRLAGELMERIAESGVGRAGSETGAAAPEDALEAAAAPAAAEISETLEAAAAADD